MASGILSAPILRKWAVLVLDMIEGFSNNPVAQRYFKKWRLNEKKKRSFRKNGWFV